MSQRKQAIVTGGSMYWRQHPETDKVTLITRVKDGPQAAHYRDVHVPLDVLTSSELTLLISALQRMRDRRLADEEYAAAQRVAEYRQKQWGGVK